MIKKRIVSIDYGRARIGLAMTDPEGRIALPFRTILAEKTMEKTIDSIIKALERVQDEIVQFVVGNPLHLNGEEGLMAKEVSQFTSLLKQKTSLPVVLWDERLTSALAERTLKNENLLSRKKRKDKVDSIAALFILQNYLEWTSNERTLSP